MLKTVISAGFGKPSTPAAPFGGSFGSPGAAFGTPAAPGGAFGAPASPGTGFGAPASPAGAFGTPATPGGFGSPAQMGSPGFGAAAVPGAVPAFGVAASGELQEVCSALRGTGGHPIYIQGKNLTRGK